MSSAKRRDVAKNAIKRYFNASRDKSIQFDKERIATYKELLDEQWASFNDFQQQVEETCGTEKMPIQENERIQTEAIFIEAAANLQRMLSEITQVDQSLEVSMVRQPVAPKLKLPAFDLPRFSGDPTNWMTFFDSFNTIVHSNEALTGSQKLYYLRCALTDEPLQLIENFKLQDSNYDEAWGLLKARYNVNRIIKDDLLAAIFAVPKAEGDTSSAIIKVVDPIMQHVRALKHFSVTVQHWDDWLIHVIVHNLAYETRRQWELSLTDDGNPKLSELQCFLEARCCSLEVLQTTQSTKAKKSNSSSKSNKPAAVHLANIVSNSQNATIDSSNQNATIDPAASNVNKSQNGNNSPRKFRCQICAGDHKLYNCDKFNSLSHTLRLENIRQIGACENCLNLHTIDKCKSLSVCRMCPQKHHTMLHNAFVIPTSTASISTFPTSLTSILTAEQARHPMSANPSNQAVQNTRSAKSVLLATALVVVHDINRRRFVLRVLLDRGSQSSFVTESCVQKLRLPRRRNNLTITGTGGMNSATNDETTLTLQPLFNNVHVAITASILPKITNLLPTTHIQPGLWPHLKGLQLADPDFATPAKIDILLGADQIPVILQPGLIIGPMDTPSAQETCFGWVLFGKADCKQTLTSLMCFQADTKLSQLIQRAWELETFNDKKYLTPEEQACEQIFDETHRRNQDGRFIVALPFKPNIELGESRQMAIKFWLSTERRLKKNEQH